MDFGSTDGNPTDTRLDFQKEHDSGFGKNQDQQIKASEDPVVTDQIEAREYDEELINDDSNEGLAIQEKTKEASFQDIEEVELPSVSEDDDQVISMTDSPDKNTSCDYSEPVKKIQFWHISESKKTDNEIAIREEQSRTDSETQNSLKYQTEMIRKANKNSNNTFLIMNTKKPANSELDNKNLINVGSEIMDERQPSKTF